MKRKAAFRTLQALPYDMNGVPKFKKASTRKITQGILLTIFASMIFNLPEIPIVFGQGTQLKVIAPTADVTVATQFNVDISVVDVVDLYAWQIVLYYNPVVLRWINATYPPGHVFDGKPNSPVSAVDREENQTTRSIMLFNALQGSQPTFNGSGILCRFSFEAKAAGSSALVFSRPFGVDTWLWGETIVFFHPEFYDIVFTAHDSSVTVVGVDIRQPSSISIEVNRKYVIAGDNVTLSGAINLTVADGTPIYIEYGAWWGGWLPFKLLATVYTTESQYSYEWDTDEWPEHDWDIRARWAGDTNYKPAISETKTVVIYTLSVDVNLDGRIDGRDIAIVAEAFASYPDHLRWNPRADLNQDNKVDGKDITFVAKNFGKTYP